MKREVQALINRRRARLVPFILLGLAVLIVAALLLLVVNFFTRGPGPALLRAPKSTPTPTATRAPATPTLASTDTPLFTPTPTFTPGPSPTPAPITYTVKEGDTLFAVAAQFNVDLCQLMAANQITNPALVGVGTTLTIPLAGVELPTPTPLPTGLPRGARITYVVQCGDSLASIAARFNSTTEDIAKRNKIRDLNSIQPGQLLDVRINIVTPTPTATLTASAPTATP